MKTVGRKILFFSVLCLFLGGCGKSSSFPSSFPSSSSSTSVLTGPKEIEGVGLTTDYVQWIGRSEFKEQDQQQYFYYTGSGCSLIFFGTTLTVTFQVSKSQANNPPYFSFLLDDQVAPDGSVFSVTEGIQTMTLVNQLPKQEHKAQILKRSEPMDAITSISKIETDGYFKMVEKTEKMNIQLIGASGISGHGAIGKPGQARTTKNSSSLHSFGYLTARLFDADFEYISNSGCGLKWGFRKTNIREAYDYVGFDTNTNVIPTLWDASLFSPDIVLVNIGGNDFNAYINNLPDQFEAKKSFRAAVKDLLSRIHSLHPNAKVIWTHTGSQNGTQAEAAISDYEKNEFVKIVVIPKVGADGDPEGANGHNGLRTHIRTADILAEAITSFTDFTPVRENITEVL